METPAAEERKISFFSTVYADVIGIALAVASSVGAAVAVINKNFFRNAEKEGRFTRFVTERDGKLKELAESGVVGKELREKSQKIKSGYYKAVETELERMEIGGAIDKLGFLGKHQKWEVALTFGAVMAGAFVGLGSIISGREIMNKQRELDKRLSNMEEHRQR